MNVFQPDKLFGIIGHPLGHTMSPLLHNWGFAQQNIRAVYMAWPTQPESIENFMHTFRTLPVSGASVTIPHKISVMDYIDKLTDRAKAIGAVNTLYWRNDQVIGDNTDTAGVSEPLRPHCAQVKKALLIGAGGASRAAIVGLQSLQIEEIHITNRTQSKAGDLAEEFNVSTVDWDNRGDQHYDLIVNSTSLGMSGKLEKINPMILDNQDANTIVYDLVYNPLETVLLREAAARKCKTIHGIEMFLHQGLAQFKIWTGYDLDETAARKLLLSRL
ncbi:shikimate dehydrogenase [Maridesulfovibrio hydrothermalis]|uniref:Shikimate dehydrogenase (NADP(+)) n=1 Tax=Maridesulfovibrio hydrothermalis AM13 = DSM 14728 TaxID=1121451 RepID=L0R9Y6_9BACT|nr:shikimate dehydrogenase [Maridesulfovibrio hydrothermalis]CCO23027.1 Shikimate dehydrogenase [Maridesulfovibrio hydrothermalis AM13 = DSM 14728]